MSKNQAGMSVEVFGAPEVIKRIWQRLEDNSFPNYAITAWSQQVNVARPARYTDASDMAQP
jgi:hypothetical protein